jgi:MFS family permease
MFLFIAWSTLSLPATFTLVGQSLPENKHAMGIGVQSLVRRIPIIVGPLAGGILIDSYGMIPGVRTGVFVSIVLGAAAIALQRRIDEAARREGQPQFGFAELFRTADSRLRRLLFSDILIRCCERLPFAWVVIFAMNNLQASATEVGLLTGIEVVTAMACYIPTAYLADRYGKEPFVIVTFIFFTLFPVVLALTDTFPMLAFAFFVRGLKEFGEPARKALILAYAPAHAKGQAVGAYYLVRDSIVSVAALAGAALWSLGPRVNFWAAAAFGAAGTIVYVASMKRRN